MIWYEKLKTFDFNHVKNIAKKYGKNKIIAEKAFILLFIQDKIINGKIIANSIQIIRVFSKIIAGTLTKNKRRKSIFNLGNS